MRKKVIFMVINMNVGGTEKALLNLIEKMPKEKYDITILMLEKYGGFLGFIPKHVHVKCLDKYQCHIKEILNQSVKMTVTQRFKGGQVIQGFSLLFIQLFAKVTNNRGIFFKYLLKDTPVLKEVYDIAIAYAGPMDLISYFVVKKINAKRRLQWIHFDVTKIGFDKVLTSKLYKKFDRLFVVSHEGKQKLQRVFPKLVDKIGVFPNIVSTAGLTMQAKNGIGFQDQFDGIRILTVGRLSLEKGQDMAIKALKILKKKGLHIRWYCIGEGKERLKYEQLIKGFGLEKDFILLGAQPNPYPYMKQCDIYVQPSRHEGYCITLAEARVLKKPIVTTNFTGAQEQIKHNVTGFIVDIHEDHIYNAIEKLINCPKQRQIFSVNLSKQKENSVSGTDQIYHLI